MMFENSSRQPAARPRGAEERDEAFTRIEKVGEGTYGVVFRCVDNKTGETVALKKTGMDAREGIPSSTLREIAVLRHIEHPNVVKLKKVHLDDRSVNLIFEYLDRDLHRMLEQRQHPVVGFKLKSYMYQLLSGLHACHRHRIVHRDLKPQNILISSDERTVKIADFGLARLYRVLTETYTHNVVTLWYRAPEIILGERYYSPAVDIWSLGCVMAEMATKKALFSSDCEIHQLYCIFKILGTPTDDMWPGVSSLPDFNRLFPKWRGDSLAERLPTIDPLGLDLLRQMLTYDPYTRITAAAALCHPWFDDVREDSLPELW